MENLRTLVTGANGFIGSNLLRAIVSGNSEVHVVLRENSNLWRIKNLIDQVEVHHCDLTDSRNVKELISKVAPDLIFHLATYGGASSQKDSLTIMETNFFGTMNLMDACIQSGFDCFINTGSSSEYGVKSEPMKETDVLEPVDYYGVSKAAATLYCQSVAKNYDLNVLTLRLFSPYGYFEDSDRLFPYLIRSCLNNEPVVLHNPTAFRDFVFVEDVVDAYLAGAKRTREIKSGDILNVGTGVQHSVRDVFNLVKSAVGYTKEARIERSGAKSRPGDSASTWKADITRIKEALGWAPRVNLNEGVEKTVAWFREYSCKHN